MLPSNKGGALIQTWCWLDGTVVQSNPCLKGSPVGLTCLKGSPMGLTCLKGSPMGLTCLKGSPMGQTYLPVGQNCLAVLGMEA